MIVQTTDACTEGLAGTRPRHDWSKRKRLHEIAVCRTPGWESLAVAVIEQAISDYFALRNAGAVRWGKMTNNPRLGKRTVKGKTYNATSIYGIDLPDIPRILKFLDGGVQHWADLCELDADGWDGLMKAIIQKERKGDYRYATT